MPQGAPRRRRGRPVADAPIDALLVRVEDLTKGWLLALLEQSPLDDAPSILAADLARDGPRICDAVIRALADEGDLRRLERDGALEPFVSQAAEFAGATGAEATSRAIDALQAVVWSALRAELPDPDADQISELAERLTRVIELVRAAALRRSAGVIGGDARGGEAGSASRLGSEAGSAALWIRAVEDEIDRSERAGSPLSLLLVELDDADRVMAAEPPAGVRATFGRFAQSVRSVVRRQDILACETDTRAWIIARDTTRAGANALAGRVASALSQAEPWRGAPLSVSAGAAVLGEDGHDAAALIEAAEVAKFEAAASGLSVVPETSGGGDEDPAGRGGPQLAG